MDLSLATPSPADALANRALAAPKGSKDPAKALQAAQDFEAVFIAQMLQPMFNTVEVNPDFGGGSAEETWRGLMVEEVSKQIARQGGLGLTPVIQKEIMHLQEVADGTH